MYRILGVLVASFFHHKRTTQNKNIYGYIFKNFIKCNLDHVIEEEIVALELESLLTFIGDEKTLSMIMLSHACLPFITPSNPPYEHIKSTYVHVNPRVILIMGRKIC
jgi:hypothetical protein